MPGLKQQRHRTSSGSFSFSSGWVAASAAAAAVALWVVAPDLRIALVLLIPPGLYLGMTSPEALRRVLLAVVVLETPIQFDRYFGHDEAEAALGALSGYAVSITTMAIVGLYWLWILEGTAQLRPPSTVSRTFLVPHALYALLVVASVTWALSPLVATYEVAILLQALAIFVWVAFNIRSIPELTFLLRLFAVAVLLQVGFAMVLLAGPATIELGPVTLIRQGSRVEGTIGSPNAYGAYLALLTPVMLAMAIGGATKHDRRLGLAGLLGGVTAMVSSGSRGAWVASFIGLGFAVIIGLRRGWLGRRVVARVLLAALIPSLLLQSVLVDRLSQFNDAAAQSRFPLMQLAWEMIVERPFLGFGANNFTAALPGFLDSDLGQTWLFTVHNKYLLVASETGVIGLVLFVWMLVWTVRLALAASHHREIVVASTAVGLAAGIVTNMVHMLADIFHDRVSTTSLWLLMGLVLALHGLVRPIASPEDTLPSVSTR
jgi:O-antigen ligase